MRKCIAGVAVASKTRLAAFSAAVCVPVCVLSRAHRDLMVRVAAMHPPAKVLPYIQEGLNSKNNR